MKSAARLQRNEGTVTKNNRSSFLGRYELHSVEKNNWMNGVSPGCSVSIWKLYNQKQTVTMVISLKLGQETTSQ